MSFINNIEIPLIKATNQNLKGYGYFNMAYTRLEKD